MNCNCKTELEAKLLERFKTKAPAATEHRAELMGYAIGVTDSGLVLAGVMPVEFTAEHPLKAGGTKRKTMRQSMHFSFCPFCGKSAAAKATQPDAKGEPQP